MRQLQESERYTKGMYCWIGFNKKEVFFDQGDRVAGKSSWNMFGLLKLAMDGITSYTTAPLRILTIFGFLISLVAFIYMLFLCEPCCMEMMFRDSRHIILFLGGIQLLSLGIIGEYVGRIFNETKSRPVYVVREY